jgi:hypothetical protein
MASTDETIVTNDENIILQNISAKKEIKTFMDEYNNQQQIIKNDLFNKIK